MEKSSGKSHCSVKKMPVPTSIACRKCGGEIELWSDEDETVCSVCGSRIFKTELVQGLSSADISL